MATTPAAVPSRPGIRSRIRETNIAKALANPRTALVRGVRNAHRTLTRADERERRRRDALLGRPEAWDDLAPEALTALLRDQCITYGATEDDRRGSHVRTLYELVVSRFDTRARFALLYSVARAVERLHREQQIEHGYGCTKALAPFLFADPDQNVVSVAASEFASLLPLDGENPLRGASTLITLIADRHDARQGALLGGLVALADRRVVALVGDARTRLGVEGQATLLQTHVPFLSAAWIDLLVEWLEEAALRLKARTVAAVADALARLPQQASRQVVFEVSRRFPGSGHDGDDPRTVVQQWTVAEYGQRLLPRLIGLTQTGVDPRLVSQLLHAWGLTGGAKGQGRTENRSGAERTFGKAEEVLA